jgi:RimJ/RimL family protein N-acetyltransferase
MKADAQFEPLLTERLRLRRSMPDDADVIAAYRSDPAVSRYQGWERVDAEGIRAELEETA